MIERRQRCGRCGWLFAESREKGCVDGDCSYRPDRNDSPEEWARIQSNKAKDRRGRRKGGERKVPGWNSYRMESSETSYPNRRKPQGEPKPDSAGLVKGVLLIANSVGGERAEYLRHVAAEITRLQEAVEHLQECERGRGGGGVAPCTDSAHKESGQ